MYYYYHHYHHHRQTPQTRVPAFGMRWLPQTGRITCLAISMLRSMSSVCRRRVLRRQPAASALETSQFRCSSTVRDRPTLRAPSRTGCQTVSDPKQESLVPKRISCPHSWRQLMPQHFVHPPHLYAPLLGTCYPGPGATQSCRFVVQLRICPAGQPRPVCSLDLFGALYRTLATRGPAFATTFLVPATQTFSWWGY